MSPGEVNGQRDGPARRALLRGLGAVLAATTCLGALAYGSTRTMPVGSPDKPGAQEPGSLFRAAAKRDGRPPPKPRIVEHPEPVTTSTVARFRFTAKRRKLRFQCRLDGSVWKSCRSPRILEGLTTGPHLFLVRAVNRARRPGPAGRYAWQIAETREFSISAQLSPLRPLYPGAPPVPLPIELSNPNPGPIFVTGLRVTVTSQPPGCDGARNVELIPSNVSSSAPLEVPGGGSVSLPARGFSAPAIQLRDLPENQDACQGGRFGLAFSGEARG